MKKLILIVLAFILLFCVNAVAFAAPESSTYKITCNVDPEGGGTVTGAGEYKIGQNAVLTATPADGYTFVGWFKGDEAEPFSTDLEYIYDLESDRTYTARFDKSLTVGVIADPATSGTVTQSGSGNYVLDESITLTAKANEGFTFVGWFDSSSPANPISTESTYTFNVAAPVSYIARFSTQYRLDVNITPAEGGEALGAGQYAGGSIVQLEAIPAKDYRFVGWVSPSDPAKVISSDVKYTFNLNENLTLTAKFDHSFGYIWLRVILIAAIAAGALLVVWIVIRRSRMMQRRKSRRGRRPSQ